MFIYSKEVVKFIYFIIERNVQIELSKKIFFLINERRSKVFPCATLSVVKVKINRRSAPAWMSFSALHENIRLDLCRKPTRTAVDLITYEYSNKTAI